MDASIRSGWKVDTKEKNKETEHVFLPASSATVSARGGGGVVSLGGPETVCY